MLKCVKLRDLFTFTLSNNCFLHINVVFMTFNVASFDKKVIDLLISSTKRISFINLNLCRLNALTSAIKRILGWAVKYK